MINGNETIHFENRNFVPFTCNSFLRRGDKVMKKVVKFGGSSLASAEQFIKVGKIILADEISPDTCRLWDSKTKEKLDKDRFRRDMGNVEGAYQEVFKRIGLA